MSPLARALALLALVASLPLTIRVGHAQVGVTTPSETIITSAGPLQMRNDGVEAYFVMTDKVRLVGTNLEVTCDKLEVFAETKKDEGASADAKGFGGIGGIRRILATGNVVIVQEGRRATAGRAEVLPLEDKIELTENPAVTDPQGTMEGSRIEIFRGEQNAVVHDPKVLLRALPNLGFPRQPGEPAPSADTTADTPPTEQPPAPFAP
jgi:lipopolysaccharide export system protein LptA